MFLYLHIYLLSILGLFVFLYGFFPLKYNSKLNKNWQNEGDRSVRRRNIDKLAFIVIDALRKDFVLPSDDRNYMPFTYSSILKKESCCVVTKAHSPTVTLPRLKAITSGSVSSYIDVLLNFMTPAFEEDNFVNIAASSGLKLVFYGDDTWLKLFPNSFTRSEGTHSFFTYDYYEVDNNVTRHIDDEFKRNDWDIIILHYLGLDHIGHTEGPKSVLIKSKLQEMDNVIKRFYHHFKKLEEKEGLKTMLIVAGDHGMKDSGGHGGVTYPEVNVPLVSVGKPCVDLPGWPKDYIPLQIDIAPTLSAAFGVPIPVKSMGKIIPALLHSLDSVEILKYLEMNRLALNKFKNPVNEEFKSLGLELEQWLLSNSGDKEVGRNMTNRYFRCLDEMSQELVTLNSDFRLIFLILGVISLWITLLFMVFKFLKHCPKPQTGIHWFLIISTMLHAVSFVSSSFIEEEHQTWYFFWATFCLFSILEVLHFTRDFAIKYRMRILLPWIVLSILHRILRKLNQTGDKWALLPDIKFYLYTEDGQLWLFLLFLLGMGLVYWCAVVERCPVLQRTIYSICLLAIIAYRVATDNFKIRYLIYPHSRGLREVYVFWVFFTIFTLLTVYNQTPFYLVWLAFISLFLRPHNIILLPTQVFISKSLYKLFHKPKDTVWNSMAHILLGNVLYFYQGNGNSLSNVDVAAGFVGVQTYSPMYAGITMTAHTFSGPILSFLLSPKSSGVFAISRIIPLTVYCTTLLFLLNHLFIWSVFSPKLLYESSLTVVVAVLLSVNHFLSFIRSCFKDSI